MELLIKLYTDKPSRLGIKYVYEYLAVREYEALFKHDQTLFYSVKLELFREKINLLLQSDATGIKHSFKALDFKLDQLNKLQAHYKSGMDMEFVHIFPKSNTLMVAKPFKRSTFLKISHLEIISSALVGGYR